MTKVQYQTEINAPIEKVYNYYTNPDNIQEAWPQDIVKESEMSLVQKVRKAPK